MKKTFILFTILFTMFSTAKVWATGGVLMGDGTSANPYLISDLADWNHFAAKLNDGATAADYVDKYYKLVADIGPVTTMASEYYSNPFRGNFNGNGHTITLALTRSTNPTGDDHAQGLALFHYVGKGCSIHDLNVTGTIETCGKFAAGFVAYISQGSDSSNPKIVSISRCRSSVTITSTVTGDATSAGFVGASKQYVNLVLNNCLFDGAFVSNTATQFSGMVGWQDGTGHANILNSLVKPGAGMSLTAPDGNHYTFCRYGGESFGMINGYYYNAIGTEQGDAVGSMSNDDLKNALGAAWLVQNNEVVPYAISYHYTLVDHYTATEANVAGNLIPDQGNHGYAKLVDGNKSTCWQTCPINWVPFTVNFESETPFVPKGYVLTLSSDIQDNPSHNPIEWYLRGKNDQGQWEVIDHRGEYQYGNPGEYLPAMNSAEKVYVKADNTTAYRQFQFEVVRNGGWDCNNLKMFEMAELQLFGILNNNDLANACINGVNDIYMWNNGNAIDINYTVTDYNGNVLTKGTDYTAAVTDTANQIVNTVTAAGNYTLTVTGTGNENAGYFGTKSIDFIVTDHPSGLSVDYSISEGNIGRYYINLPKNRQTVIDLGSMTTAFTTPFKVYDDGGRLRKFTQGCSEDLLVVAPEGYVFQVCGTIDIGDETLLEFYDGTWGENLMAGNFNRCIGDDIGFLITTGPQLAIKYNTSTAERRAGLNLTVIPVSANAQSNITINDDEHGSVTASVNNSMVTKATVNSLVTLTATPESGYMPNGFTVTDDQGHNIPVTGGWYTDNTATFIMPGSAVTITPSFVTTAYSTDLSVNIPRYSSNATDALVATIPANVGCFKIYDNGGPNNDYSYSSDGYLLLVAPENKVIQLTAVTMHNIWPSDYLEVFDGNTTDHPLGGPYSFDDNLGTLTSTGNQMLLHFICNYTHYSTNEGLNLLARVYDTSTQFAISVNPSEEGTVAVDPVSGTASVSSTVTLTFTPNEGYSGYRANNFTTNYPSVLVEGGWYSNNVMTFTMPAGPVTVTPDFTTATTAEDGLYVNMPKKNTYATSRMVNIPQGVSSFKVYDDGGATGIYSDFCDGYMILTAPEGKIVRLTGTIQCEPGLDFLEVYDGNTTTDQLLGSFSQGSYNQSFDIGALLSTGQSMLLHFYSNNWNQFALDAGLNLTVTVYKPNCWGTGTDGTAEHPYEISDMDGLQTLAALSESDSFADKYFKLTANIGTAENPFRMMIGDNTNYPFSGVFDGDGHTITIALNNNTPFEGNDEAEQGTALFHYAGSGCDIKNLTIDGTINTANKFAGSLIAYIRSGESGNPKAIALSNCHSRVVITSTKSGDNTTGGFIGLVKEHVALTLIKCVFDGAFISAEGTQFSGFVGYQAKQVETNISYGIMAADITGLGVQNGNHYTFCRYNGQGKLTFNEVNYYHNALGTAQGTQAYRLTLPLGVTAVRESAIATGNDEAYVYTNGFNLGECPYFTSYNNGPTVTLAPSTTSFTITSATVTYGENSWSANANGDGTYWFNMPASDATITATMGVQITVTGYGESTASEGWVFLATPTEEEFTPSVDNHFLCVPEAKYDLYRFNQSAAAEWENFKVHYNQGTFRKLTNGRGYLYARKETTTLTFTSPFNCGPTQEIALAYDANARLKGCNLVGNPFPVAAYVNMPYYKMNAEGSNVEAVENYWASSIPACTGVVVVATGENQKVTFSMTSPEAPVTATGDHGSMQLVLTQAVDSSDPDSRFASLRGTKQSSMLDKAIVSFNEGSELGKFYFGEQDANIYLPQDGKEYAIVSSDGVGEMPLNFRANKNGEYTLTVKPENVELGYLHLIDNMTGADVDLLGSPEYTFTAKPTDYASRFKLVFATQVPEPVEGPDPTFAFCANGDWIILNDGEATLQVIDVMGRLLSSQEIHSAFSIQHSEFPTPGVYVLRLINGNEIRTQKIVIQ